MKGFTQTQRKENVDKFQQEQRCGQFGAGEGEGCGGGGCAIDGPLGALNLVKFTDE